jgi:hypothetical protein
MRIMDATARTNYVHLKRLAPLLAFSVLGVMASSLRLQAQFESLGLRGYRVYDLSNFWNGKVYAATEEGVYAGPVGGGDTTWTLLGLQGKSMRAVYPHEIGPFGYAVTAGVQRKVGDTDSTLIYCSRYSDVNWAPADSGVNRAEINSVRSIRGFPSLAICGETFAGGQGKVYVRTSDVWKEVFDIGIGIVNVVRADLRNVTVWVGGETAIFAPYIAHSTDKGATWITTFPDLAGDNACNSLSFDPIDTSVVYAGMEGSVIKSTDGGLTWFTTSLSATPYYFYGLAYDSFTGSLFAGGMTSGGNPGFYVSRNHGNTWESIPVPSEWDGILCMTIMPTMIPEKNILLMGTLTTGVVGYAIPMTEVKESQLPGQMSLQQNYPNPFNPSTVIEYALGTERKDTRQATTLVIYDLLGSRIVTLVDEMQPPGAYSKSWNGIDQSGKRVASGIYLYRLSAQGHTLTRAMIVLR